MGKYEKEKLAAQEKASQSKFTPRLLPPHHDPAPQIDWLGRTAGTDWQIREQLARSKSSKDVFRAPRAIRRQHLFK